MYAEHTYILKTSDFHIDKENTNPIFPGIAGYLLWNKVLNGLTLFPCSMQNQSGKFTGYKYTALMKKKKNPFYAWTDKLIPKRYPRNRSAKCGLLLLFFLALITLQKRVLAFPLLLSLRNGGWQYVMDVLPQDTFECFCYQPYLFFWPVQALISIPLHDSYHAKAFHGQFF